VKRIEIRKDPFFTQHYDHHHATNNVWSLLACLLACLLDFFSYLSFFFTSVQNFNGSMTSLITMRAFRQLLNVRGEGRLTDIMRLQLSPHLIRDCISHSLLFFPEKYLDYQASASAQAWGASQELYPSSFFSTIRSVHWKVLSLGQASTIHFKAG
jgi:hypothetical protein